MKHVKIISLLFYNVEKRSKVLVQNLDLKIGFFGIETLNRKSGTV